MSGTIVKTGETVHVPGLYKSINCEHDLERSFTKGEVAASCHQCHKMVIWKLMREDEGPSLDEKVDVLGTRHMPLGK